MGCYLRSVSMVTGIAIALGTPAFAGVVVSVVDDQGDPHATTVEAGGTFNVRIEVDSASDSLVSAQCRLSDASNSGVFSLVSVSYDSSVWQAGQGSTALTPPSHALSGPSFRSMPVGTTAIDLSGGTGSGTFCFVAQLTIGVNGNAPEGDYPLNVEQLIFGNTSFAELEASAGSDYTVTVGDGHVVPVGLSLASAVSRRAHGASGDFDLSLPLSGAPEIEARKDGSNPRTVLRFNEAVKAVDGQIDCGEVLVTNGSCSGVSILGTDVIVEMTFNQNSCVQVAVGGIESVNSGEQLSAPAEVKVRVMQGDATGDRE